MCGDDMDHLPIRKIWAEQNVGDIVATSYQKKCSQDQMVRRMEK